MSHPKQVVLLDIITGIVASAESATPESEGSGEGAATATAPAKPKRKARPRSRRKTTRLPPWNVILLDDDDHTYQYVIEMLGHVFGHGLAKAFVMAREVDATGRVIVFTGHRELAELKREQIISYGLDPRISSCRGSMRAVLEPAEIG